MGKARNPLTTTLIEMIALAHDRDVEIASMETELAETKVTLAATSDALKVAVSMLTTKDAENDRLRQQNIFQRAQLRAAASGKTIADERQQAEADAIAEWSMSEAD